MHQGYLGAGKTTLLNYILTEKHGKKIAVIMNGKSIIYHASAHNANTIVQNSETVSDHHLECGCSCRHAYMYSVP